MHQDYFTYLSKFTFRKLQYFKLKLYYFICNAKTLHILTDPVLFYKHLHHSLIDSPISSKSSKHLHSQTVRARELKFGEKVHLPPHVMCLMSHFTFYMSHFTCHMSHFTQKNIKSKVVKLVGGWSVIKRSYPVQFRIHFLWLFPSHTEFLKWRGCMDLRPCPDLEKCQAAKICQ